MSFFLEVISGVDLGARFTVRPEMTLGRRQTDILLKDPKVSGIHAKIESRESGPMVLVDLDSVNGIRVDGKKVKELPLWAERQFQLGQTVFKVLEIKDPHHEHSSPLLDSWSTSLQRLMERALQSATDEQKPLRPFPIRVELRIVQGPQNGTVWSIGYGPRAVGRQALDLQIEDPECPGLAFRLVPIDLGVQFQSDHPEKVMLNFQDVRTANLKHGDRISIGQTIIEIHLSVV